MWHCCITFGTFLLAALAASSLFLSWFLRLFAGLPVCALLCGLCTLLLRYAATAAFCRVGRLGLAHCNLFVSTPLVRCSRTPWSFAVALPLLDPCWSSAALAALCCSGPSSLAVLPPSWRVSMALAPSTCCVSAQGPIRPRPRIFTAAAARVARQDPVTHLMRRVAAACAIVTCCLGGL